MQPDQQQRIMGYFIEEAKDHLNTIEQGLLNLQSTIEDPEMMNEVFRAAHSVKGGAAMLGLSSIQKVAHRLEDFFKLLKESPVRTDQKLETLFLRAFDALQELLGQLQGPFGLTEDAAKNILTDVEPNFNELEHHLNHLISQASVPSISGSGLGQTSSYHSDEALIQRFRTDVTAALRDMLQMFKQPDADASVRQRLQDLCQSLASMGERYSLSAWESLLQTVKRAIADPDNSYRTLAPLVIKDIKRAQELVLTGRAHEILPCPQIQQLAPVPQTETFIQEDLADFLAEIDSAELQPSASEIDLASMQLDEIELELEQSTTDPISSAATSPFDHSGVAAEIAAFDMVDEFGDESLALEELTRNGPEVGMAELNSLADLFEGELPDLGLTWQEEVAIEHKDESQVSQLGEGRELDSTSDFSDLLFEETTTERPQSALSDAEDFGDLFDDDLSESDNLDSKSDILFSSPDFDLADSDLNPFDDLLEITDSPATAPTSSLHLDQAGLNETDLNETTLDETGLDKANLDPVGLDKLTLEQTGLEGIGPEGIDLEEIDLEGIGLEEPETSPSQEMDFGEALGNLSLEPLESADPPNLDAFEEGTFLPETVDSATNELDDLDNLFGDLSLDISTHASIQEISVPEIEPSTSDPWSDDLNQEIPISAELDNLSLDEFNLDTSSLEADSLDMPSLEAPFSENPADLSGLDDLDFDSLTETPSPLEQRDIEGLSDDGNGDNFDSLFDTPSIPSENSPTSETKQQFLEEDLFGNALSEADPSATAESSENLDDVPDPLAETTPSLFDELDLGLDDASFNDIDLGVSDLKTSGFNEPRLEQPRLDGLGLDGLGLNEIGSHQFSLDEPNLSGTNLNRSNLDELVLNESNLDELVLDESNLDELVLDESGLDESCLDDLGLEAPSLDSGADASGISSALDLGDFADSSDTEIPDLANSSLPELDDFLDDAMPATADSSMGDLEDLWLEATPDVDVTDNASESLNDFLDETSSSVADTTVIEDLNQFFGESRPSQSDNFELENLDSGSLDSENLDIENLDAGNLVEIGGLDLGTEILDFGDDQLSLLDEPLTDDLLELPALASTPADLLEITDLSNGTARESHGLDDLDSLLDADPIAANDFGDISFAADQLAETDHALDPLLATSAPPPDEFAQLDDLLGTEVGSVAESGFDDLEDLLSDDLVEQSPNGDLFGDLDDLLDVGIPPIEIDDTLSEVSAFTEMTPGMNVTFGQEPILEQGSVLGQESALGDFSDLEALLDGETFDVGRRLGPESISTETPVTINDTEFDDLDNLLKETEEKMGGSPSVSVGRGMPPQTRRSVRPSRGFSEQTMRVPVKHLDNLSNLVGELVVNRNSLEQDQERLRQSLDNLLYQVQQLSDVGQRMQDLYERSLLESSLLASRQGYRMNVLQPVSQEAVATEVEHASETGIEYDPLEMDRFTGFHSLSQEMIELIVRVRESSSDIEFIVDETEQVTRMFRQVTTQLQEGLTRSRMVPFAQTADRLPRAIRDISMKVGKQVELILEGRETLIDKMILEQLYDPMTHLVNNALTHGIESPDVRRALGKSPSGRITIRAYHQGNQTIISVSDDGAGIDIDRVKAKAIEKGLLSAIEVNSLSRLDIYDILFHPGFSTKDQADDFSGRGVGMDVVRTSLSEIRGVINTDSTPHKGTTFTIRLPLTLSISKALCCISDRARIAFPMDGVEDMLDVPKDRIQTDASGKPCITWRDTTLLVHPLSELLTYSRHLSRGNVYGGNQEDDIMSIVVLRSAGNFLALQVDQVLGEQEIVIKQLEGPVPKPVGVAGATVLGDGRIMPIADVLELIDLSMGRIRRDASGSLWEQAGGQAMQDAPIAKTEPMVLIVDDSITVRELLSMTFNKVGYRVEQARDGQEAWEKLRSGLPCDIVFCDIEMPRMDGLELLSRIQKDPNLKQLPIAMLTSRGADRHRQMAASLGASGYFTKPYLEEALLDAAQRMLKGERLLNAI
jgi:chemosensory pili system protein ChpA (sensor histidine kinase/response regulator)